MYHPCIEKGCQCTLPTHPNVVPEVHLFGYIIEYRVTTISQRLQKSECGYIPPAYPSDCIHNPRLFQKTRIPFRGFWSFAPRGLRFENLNVTARWAVACRRLDGGNCHCEGDQCHAFPMAVLSFSWCRLWKKFPFRAVLICKRFQWHRGQTGRCLRRQPCRCSRSCCPRRYRSDPDPAKWAWCRCSSYG